MARLRQFWTLAEQLGKPDPSDKDPGDGGPRLAKRIAAAQTFVTGRPGLFTPRLPGFSPGLLQGFWPSCWPDLPHDVSLFDTAPLTQTLRQCIDFDRLNDGTIRLTATAVDLETGEDVAFDTARERIGAEHLRASAAFPGFIFPPDLSVATLSYSLGPASPRPPDYRRLLS